MTTVHPAIHNALNLDGNPETLKRYYADWAARYDADVADEMYAGPQVMVDLLNAVLSKGAADSAEIKIIDAGCGTGLVGKLLHDQGLHHIDGFDLSSDMVKQAAQLNIYKNLIGNVDLNQPLTQYAPSSYDVVMCCGVFTLGHVPPEAMAQLLYLCKSGGLIITSTRTAYYDASDYQQVTDQLIQDGQVELLQLLRDAPYTTDGNSHYWAYRKIASQPISESAGQQSNLG